MKKFVFWVIFMFLTMSIFGQLPNVVVSDFTSRARDVHEDDLVTVMEMFMNSLATGRTANVIDRTILEKGMEAIKFEAGDWSDSAKTTRLGEELNADYLVSGTMTQLGTSLTFSITVRDIKTLVVIASDQKQYTLENVWDNSTGIPAQLSGMAGTISRGISTEYNKRQQEIQAQIAKQEAEKKEQFAKEEARQEEARKLAELKRLMVTGVWREGSFPRERDYDSEDNYTEIKFNNNGSFTAERIYWASIGAIGEYIRAYCVDRYTGTYTFEGSMLALSWTKNSKQTNWKSSGFLGSMRPGDPVNRTSSGKSRTSIKLEDGHLHLNDEFRGEYRNYTR